MRVTEKKVIALVDPYVTGHHATYFKLFTKALLELDYKVMAFYPQQDEICAWIVNTIPHHADNLYTFTFRDATRSRYLTNRLGILVTTYLRWRLTAIAIKDAVQASGISPDLVFFAWLDSYLQPLHTAHIIERIFPFPWTGLYYHPRHYRLTSLYPHSLSNLLYPDNALKSANCRGVAILDEGIQKALQHEYTDTRVVVFPDPTDQSAPLSSPLAELVKRQAKGRKIVGLLGSLDKRKGVIPLLKVAEQASSDPFFFLIAGRLAENTFTGAELAFIRDYERAKPDNCILNFEHIAPESKFNGLVSLCDILCAVYLDFPHSSGILGKAAEFEKPIIVSNKYCMGERVSKYEIGLTVDENDTDALYQAICQLTTIQQQESNFNLRFDFATYRQVHSHSQLQQSFATLLSYS